MFTQRRRAECRSVRSIKPHSINARVNAGLLEKEFAEFLANRDDDLGEAMRYVRDLDADLMVNKSLSLTARVRMQAQRELDRNFERRKRAYLGQIKHLAGLA